MLQGFFKFPHDVLLAAWKFTGVATYVIVAPRHYCSNTNADIISLGHVPLYNLLSTSQQSLQITFGNSIDPKPLYEAIGLTSISKTQINLLKSTLSKQQSICPAETIPSIKSTTKAKMKISLSWSTMLML
jgi:hypothetical protein